MLLIGQCRQTNLAVANSVAPANRRLSILSICSSLFNTNEVEYMKWPFQHEEVHSYLVSGKEYR